MRGEKINGGKGTKRLTICFVEFKNYIFDPGPMAIIFSNPKLFSV
jgi:hypothetical protein